MSTNNPSGGPTPGPNDPKNSKDAQSGTPSTSGYTPSSYSSGATSGSTGSSGYTSSQYSSTPSSYSSNPTSSYGQSNQPGQPGQSGAGSPYGGQQYGGTQSGSGYGASGYGVQGGLNPRPPRNDMNETREFGAPQSTYAQAGQQGYQQGGLGSQYAGAQSGYGSQHAGAQYGGPGQQGPYGGGANQSPYPGMPQQESGDNPNVAGIIGLILAVVGFILSCIPIVQIFGWLVLLLALILGVVGLFIQSKSKIPAVAAIVVSIIGGIVGTFVSAGILAAIFANGDFESTTDDPATAESSASAESSAAKPSSAEKESAPDSNHKGTREDPLALGTPIESGDWIITVNSVDLDAHGKVMAENPFNDDPGADKEYILINVTAEYQGDAAEGEGVLLDIAYVGSDGNTYSWMDHVAVVPDDLDMMKPLFKGGSVSGNVGIAVPKDTKDQGVVSIRSGFEDKKHFVAVK